MLLSSVKNARLEYSEWCTVRLLSVLAMPAETGDLVFMAHLLESTTLSTGFFQLRTLFAGDISLDVKPKSLMVLSFSAEMPLLLRFEGAGVLRTAARGCRGLNASGNE